MNHTGTFVADGEFAARPIQALASLAAFLTGHFAAFLSRTSGPPAVFLDEIPRLDASRFRLRRPADFDVKANKPSRRAALGALASVPALAILLVAASSPSTPQFPR